MEHELQLTERSKLHITAVTSVDGFDEEAIFVNLNEESMVIYGQNLHIDTLDLDEGVLTATGKVESIIYTKKKVKKSIIERLRK